VKANRLYCKDKRKLYCSLSEEISLEGSSEKTKHVLVFSCEQNSGQHRDIKTGNKSFERVGEFRYMWEHQ